MSRRKHLLQELERDLPPLEEANEVVRVVAPRGSNLVDVERADGTRTLCLMPKKFNRTLWVKRDGYLLIERADGIPSVQQASKGSEQDESHAAPMGTCLGEACTVAAQGSSQQHGPEADQHLAEPGSSGSGSSTQAGTGLASGLSEPSEQEQQGPTGRHAPQACSAQHQHTGLQHAAAALQAQEPLEATAMPVPSTASSRQPPVLPAPLATSTRAGAAATAATAGGAAIQSSQQQLSQLSKVIGTIVAVLYDDQIKQLKKIPGAWPEQFNRQKALQQQSNQATASAAEGHEEGCSDYSDSDDSLPPLERNMNRRVIVHEESEESGSDDS